MNRPTEKDIETVKAYLRQRLDAERSMTYNLEMVMREAAERIVSICYSAKIDPSFRSYETLPFKVRMQVEEVVQWLKETTRDYFVTLSIYDHEDTRDEILPFIMGENHGMTFDERLTDYCYKYRDELMLLIGAGLFLEVTKKVLATSIGEYLKKPYKNPKLIEGIAAPLTYGRGRTNSMFTAISDLTRFGIGQAWMLNQYIDNKANGCIGWYVQRGSSYPCELCDSKVGFHSDDSDLPLYHSHCCCIATPVFLK